MRLALRHTHRLSRVSQSYISQAERRWAMLPAHISQSSRSVTVASAAGGVRDSSVIISGGGFSGIGCATELAKHGVDVVVAEQGRGYGGRVATRRTRGGEPVTFDHGCQYFSPKGGEFLDLIQQLEAEGLVARWGDGRLGEVSSSPSGGIDWGSFEPNPPSKRVWVGLPTMSSVGKHLVESAGPSLTFCTSTRLAPGSLQRDPATGLWRVETHPAGKSDPPNRTATRHSVVLAAGSASSTFNVISPAAPELAAPAGTVGADCCWALLVAFREPLFPDGLPCDGALVKGSPSIAWFARDSSKPGRDAKFDCWVVHATAAWSNPLREQTGAETVAPLLAEWLRECGRDGQGGRPPAPEIAYVEAHRWNAAFPLNPLSPPEKCFWDARAGLGLAGDYCVGPRAGDAFESGRALARRVLESGVVKK